MLIIIFILIIVIIVLGFKLMDKEVKYLGHTSSLKLELKEKNKQIAELIQLVMDIKNLSNYEPEV